MKACISIPVHESADVAIDQIRNIRAAYGGDAFVVLHRSAHFRPPERLYGNRDYNLYDKDDVFVNPVSLPTEYHRGLVHVHNANFRFAASVADFDVFVLHASNDLYVRKGAASRLASARNACMLREVRLPSWWGWSEAALADPELRDMMRYAGLNTVYHTQPEGIFFEKDVFREMVAIIDRWFEYGRGPSLPREELYYSTLAPKLADSLSATPLVWSEVTVGGKLDSDVVRRIREQEGELGEPYDPLHIYAVKRVERNYDDPLRRWIREAMS